MRFLRASRHKPPDAKQRPAATALIETVRAGVNSPSQALDLKTRAFMESRFRADFSHVKVHTDASASHSAQSLRARAYTVGDDVVFNHGEFSPTSAAGRLLLAHELAHTVQQQGRSRDVSNVGAVDDRVERDADRAASQVASTQQMSLPPTLAQDASADLRRTPIHTWGGDFDIGKQGYAETYQESKAPVSSGSTDVRKTVRPGVKMHLKFSPDPKVVDAEEIAFVQAITTLRNDLPHFLGKTEESRSIPAGDAGEGMHVDSFRTEKSPFITQATGAHFSDKKTETTGDAEMIDTPGFEIWDTDTAEMEATTAAVATKGKQAGAFYGAVRWGWTRAAKDKPKKFELAATASPLPGGTLFKTIAGLWEKSKTSLGAATDHLPTVDVKFTTKATQLVQDPAKPKAKGSVSLDINTEIQVTEARDPTNKGWQNVIVTSGKYIGKRGWVSEPLSDTKVLIPKSKPRPRP